MLREVDIQEIWDGRFYKADDRVKVGCNNCEGCSDCCRLTGDSIILDPYDMFQLEKATGKSFEEMMEKEIEIRMVDGMILPNIMEHDEEHPERSDRCPFLNEQERCSIHQNRPGICRLFPVGRFYTEENGERSFRYFVQRNECTKKDAPRYKVKLKEWLDIPELDKYEDYITRWHFFLKDVSDKLNTMNEESRDPIQRYVLQMFFVAPYNTDMNFYAQFEMRLAKVRMVLAPMGV